MVFIREVGMRMPFEFHHLHRVDQYDRVLVALFESGLRHLFGVAPFRAGANLEQPCQLCAIVYLRACAWKN